MTGHVQKIKDLVETAQRLTKESGYEIAVGEKGLGVQLCPTGELQIAWEKDAKKSGQWMVTVDCQTTPAGAGFHKAALELAEKLGIEDLKVDDETDYYSHRDFMRMKREHFYPYMRTMIKFCQEKLDKESSHICLSWNLDWYNPENVSQTVVTPMGRFKIKTLTELLEQQEIETLAQRFFLWENEKRDALFYRNRAIHQLWVECYFAPSSRSEMDKTINENILKDLEKAYQMNPQLAFPYKVYQELCKLDNKEPAIHEKRAELLFDFPVGYRKGLIAERLGKLRLTLPGSYQYECEAYDDGDGTNLWCDTSIDSPVWRVSGFRAQSGKATFSEDVEGLNNLTECDISNGRMRFGWRKFKENRKTFYAMECEVIAGEAFYFITVTYQKTKEKEKVIELLYKISAV